MDSSPFFILFIVLGVLSQSFCCNPNNQKSASSASPTTRPSLYEKLKQSAKVQAQDNSQKNQGAPTTSQTLSDNKSPAKDSNEFYSSQFESQFNKGFDATQLKDLNGQQFIDHMNSFITKSPTGPTAAGFTGPVTYGAGSGKTKSNIQSGFNAGAYPEDDDYNKNVKGRAVKNENKRQKHKHHDDNNNGYFPAPPTFVIPTPSIPEEHEQGFSFIPKSEAHQHFHDNNNNNNFPDVNIKTIAGQLDFHKDSNFVNNPEDYQNGNTLDYNSNNENENGQQYTEEFNGPHGKVNFNYNVNSAPFPHFEAQDGHNTNGFYNVDDPSGSWRNVAYNAGPTGFYANTNQAIQHGQGVSYGNFKTFEAGQNFGF